MNASTAAIGFLLGLAALYLLRVDLLPTYQEAQLRNAIYVSQNYGVQY